MTEHCPFCCPLLRQRLGTRQLRYSLHDAVLRAMSEESGGEAEQKAACSPAQEDPAG